MFTQDFPIFSDSSRIFLDSASSTQKPRQVIDAMVAMMEHRYANIHRGAYDLSMEASDIYERSKKKLAIFL